MMTVACSDAVGNKLGLICGTGSRWANLSCQKVDESSCKSLALALPFDILLLARTLVNDAFHEH